MGTVKLTGLKLINFQTWDSISIRLGPGLNIVNADNGVGKSVILKALKFSLNPSKYSSNDRKDLIRHKCDFSDIFYEFSNSVVYKIHFTQKTVMYSIIDQNLILTHLGSEPPKEMIGYFGSIIKGDIISNIVSMDSCQLLIDSNYKDNSDLLSLLLNNEDLDKLIEGADARIPDLRRKVKEIENDISFFSNQLMLEPKYNMEVKVSNLNLSECLLNFLPLLMDIGDILDSLDCIGGSVKKIENFPSIIRDLYDMSVYLGNLSNSQISPNSTELLELINSLKEISDSLESVKPIGNVNECSSLISCSRKLIDVYELLNSLVPTLPIDKLKYLMNLVEGFYRNNYVLDNVLRQGDLISEIEDLEMELDSLMDNGGEPIDCPVLGKVIFTQYGECIPINH